MPLLLVVATTNAASCCTLGDLQYVASGSKIHTEALALALLLLLGRTQRHTETEEDMI
jgi:hypothetical protein